MYVSLYISIQRDAHIHTNIYIHNLKPPSSAPTAYSTSVACWIYTHIYIDSYVLCIRISLYLFLSIYTYTHIHMYICTYAYTYTHVRIYIYTYIHIHIHIYIYIYTYIHIHISLYVYMHMYKNIHIYIRTLTPPSSAPTAYRTSMARSNDARGGGSSASLKNLYMPQTFSKVSSLINTLCKITENFDFSEITTPRRRLRCRLRMRP